MLIAFIGNYDDIYYGTGLNGHPVLGSVSFLECLEINPEKRILVRLLSLYTEVEPTTTIEASLSSTLSSNQL